MEDEIPGQLTASKILVIPEEWVGPGVTLITAVTALIVKLDSWVDDLKTWSAEARAAEKR